MHRSREETLIQEPGHSNIVEFDVLLEQDEDGEWAVSVPALPGCFSQGDTRTEALENIREAIALHLEAAKPVPLQAVKLARVHVEA
jgi:predicted RNase H-like HicB family nuclease